MLPRQLVYVRVVMAMALLSEIMTDSSKRPMKRVGRVVELRGQNVDVLRRCASQSRMARAVVLSRVVSEFRAVISHRMGQ